MVFTGPLQLGVLYESMLSFHHAPQNITYIQPQGFFLPLVHLHIDKQCPHQNIIHDSSHHLYYPTVIPKMRGKQYIPAEPGSVAPCTTAPAIYQKKLSAKLIQDVS